MHHLHGHKDSPCLSETFAEAVAKEITGRGLWQNRAVIEPAWMWQWMCVTVAHEIL